LPYRSNISPPPPSSTLTLLFRLIPAILGSLFAFPPKVFFVKLRLCVMRSTRFLFNPLPQRSSSFTLPMTHVQTPYSLYGLFLPNCLPILQVLRLLLFSTFTQRCPLRSLSRRFFGLHVSLPVNRSPVVPFRAFGPYVDWSFGNISFPMCRLFCL